MPPLLRLPLFALVCIALLASFSVAFTSWWGEAGGAWDTVALGRQLVLEDRLHEALGARDRVVVECVEGKYQVIKEVLAGRLTVDGAVEHFRRLEEARDEALGRTPRATGPEREAELYRSVRTWMETQQAAHRRGTGVQRRPTRREGRPAQGNSSVPH
jgi:hypothetical protein